MDQAVFQPKIEQEASEGADQRSAPRFTLLIRAAKLVCDEGEFICVIRDVSATGVSVRTFHDLPQCDAIALELQSGQCYSMHKVWAEPGAAGFEFVEEVDVRSFVHEAGRFPKRGLRLGLQVPIEIGSLGQRATGTILNISQQGARIGSTALFAIDQNLRIAGAGIPERRAKVRWRRDEQYGVVFDDTFTMSEFARLVASLQCPELVEV